MTNNKAKEVNIICDVAGQYDTMIALLDKMPKGAYVQGVGDLIDRGPKSKEVIEFFMEHDKNGTGGSLLGNHEHLMLDHYGKIKVDDGTSYYDPGTWYNNGGLATLSSFGEPVPESVLEWVAGLSLIDFFGDVFVAHSFIPRHMSLAEACLVDTWENRYRDPVNLIWGREQPQMLPEYSLQVAGHNSQFGYKQFKDEDGKSYAVCLDSTRYKTMTGIHLPSREIYQQPYI